MKTASASAVMSALAALALAASAADGIESDSGDLGGRAAKSAERFASPHVKVTAWELMDQTDSHNELVSKREWLLMPGEAPVTLSLNVLDAMDVTSGKGVVFVRVAPLPHARSDKRPDFRVVAGRPHAVEVLSSAYRCERIPYEGGTLGRHRALMAAQRRWRAYVPGRDGLDRKSVV